MSKLLQSLQTPLAGVTGTPQWVHHTPTFATAATSDTSSDTYVVPYTESECESTYAGMSSLCDESVGVCSALVTYEQDNPLFAECADSDAQQAFYAYFDGVGPVTSPSRTDAQAVAAVCELTYNLDYDVCTLDGDDVAAPLCVSLLEGLGLTAASCPDSDLKQALFDYADANGIDTSGGGGGDTGVVDEAGSGSDDGSSATPTTTTTTPTPTKKPSPTKTPPTKSPTTKSPTTEDTTTPMPSASTFTPVPPTVAPAPAPAPTPTTSAARPTTKTTSSSTAVLTVLVMAAATMAV